MQIKIGDIFASNAKTLVNTINCVGVMGKGVALEFKKRYPQMYKEYVMMCQDKQIHPGIPYYYSDLSGTSIINFPTKDHWRSPSKLSYIISGLKWFREHYQDLGITSIAFPPLGCGNGGLNWGMVGPLMYEYLHDLPINIEVFAPYGTPREQLKVDFLSQNGIHSSQDVLGGKSIPFNKAWLLILYVVKALNEDRYSLSVGRVIFQKICFLLTRLGITTGFSFVRNSYGPYSKEVANAITALSNANLMIEKQAGKMVETRVSPYFSLNKQDYSKNDWDAVDSCIDLLSRIKNTAQAEKITTVIYSHDILLKEKRPTEEEILSYVFDWKPHWKDEESEVLSTLKSLSELGWIAPDTTSGYIELADDDLF